MSHYEAVMSRLRQHPLRNITLLKMMTAYHDKIDSYLIEQQAHWGVLLLMPAGTFAYDKRTYPEADTVVMMDYCHPEVFQALLALLPMDARYVFKLQKEAYLKELAPYFKLLKVRSIYSYSTAEDQSFIPDADCLVSEDLDERLLPLWTANDYSLEEIRGYFQAGAFSATLFDGELPLSTCIVFRNEESIWEIGAVHTVPAARRKGLAQRVVRTALAHTLQRGYIPRYQVLEDNLASITLAESLGLKLAVKLEHWINYTPEQLLQK
ncbi:GNAT family N-acetyltransferase [Paenibacillus sp. MMS20-IR301]|uniref:GNAT family N-acetyltransferase n=1 Tax=Paenibacillus sp. MMS20-IR301 TaxID=2895946 RepID=UPI0028E28A87|nr:GNAT family N-acetyltransferase [Paenibacillus sp. MMS20-IR301]WNS45125.1 GNAT family N-acetyltransferase [Paenibacillus sp. MMS20-IR301]